MVNYAKYKIIREISCSEGLKGFQLDGYVRYKEEKYESDIRFVDRHPFNSYRVGDYLEIDLDRMVHFKYLRVAHAINDTSIARKYGEIEARNNNNAVIPSISQGQVNTVIGQINSAINTDERNEYEAKIHVDPNSGKYSGFSIIGRRK